MEQWALPTIDSSVCTACGLCAEYCPTDAVEMVGGRPSIVRPADCAYCGRCEEICPVGAIALEYEVVWGAQEAPQDQ